MRELERRKYIIGFIFIAIALIFIVRLFYVQIINDKYKLSADNNVLRKVTLYAARGLIYDRHGKLLVYNEAAYDLMVVPGQVEEMDTTLFCDLMSITKADFISKLEEAKNYSYYKPSVFEKEISAESYASIQEKLFNFHGFFMQTRTLRNYPQRTAPHLLGYIGEVSKQTVEKKPYYRSGDYIGKSGLEYTYEKALRGKRGVKMVLVDVHNREKESFEDGKYDTLAVSGIDITTTVDAELQAYGERLMNNKIGSIVAIEPSTGEVLSLVSSPDYDPNKLVGRELQTNYPKLNRDSLKPLFNRALMAKYPPGSIFKLVQALIGLEEEVITENTAFTCNKSLVGCHNHPYPSNVKKSVQFSCNPYYYNVFKRIINQGISDSYFKDSEIGLGIWKEHVLTFGLGQRLGIDLPSVKSGGIPGVDYYDRLYGEGRWAFSTIYSLSIGQGEIEVIPLQMANLAAIVANKGYYITPHLVKQIGDSLDKPENFKRKNYTSVDSSHYTVVRNGMAGVVNEPYGTARRARLDSIVVCGKTGTAENPHGEDHSVFIAFAPKENPKIAIAVYVENSGFGGTWSAPIAGLMIEKYLKGEVSEKRREKRILEADLLDVKKKEN